jgi:putative transposase
MVNSVGSKQKGKPTMSNTYPNLVYHIVYSTKYRRQTLSVGFRPTLYSYIGGIVGNRDGALLEIGGTEDHIHILARLSPKHAVMDVLRDVKSDSSKWLNENQSFSQRFEWQAGYGAFSVSASQVDAVRSYIQNQEEHHRKLTFKDEFMAFLRKHQVEFQLKYVFDEEHIV